MQSQTSSQAGLLVWTRLVLRRFFGRGQGELIKTRLPWQRSFWLILRRGELVKTVLSHRGFGRRRIHCSVLLGQGKLVKIEACEGFCLWRIHCSALHGQEKLVKTKAFPAKVLAARESTAWRSSGRVSQLRLRLSLRRFWPLHCWSSVASSFYCFQWKLKTDKKVKRLLFWLVWICLDFI